MADLGVSTNNPRRSGRPNHPAWEHFLRGGKRNRFHHHAYCKFCVAQHGKDNVQPIRGVSMNMIKHLETCLYCPEVILSNLKSLIKSMEGQGKRNGKTVKGSVEVVDAGEPGLLERSYTPKRKVSRPISNNALPPKKARSSDMTSIRSALIKATVAAQLPFDWLDNPQVNKLFSSVCTGLDINAMSTFSDGKLQRVAEKTAQHQLNQLKGERHGLTLSLNTFQTIRHQDILCFSLINNRDQSTAISVTDITDSSSDSHAIAMKISEVLDELDRLEVRLVAIVADTHVSFLAARRVSYTRRPDLVAFPCIMKQLSLFAGLVLTNKNYNHVVSSAIEVVSCMNSPSLLDSLSDHIGERMKLLPLPTTKSWFSYLECFDYLKKFEEAIKIVVSQHPHRVSDTIMSLVEDDTFWKGVNEIRELVEPLREVHEVLSQESVNVCLVVYQLARLHHQYTIMESTHRLSTKMLDAVDQLWKQYEAPFMLLCYVLNFHVGTSYINTRNKQVQWLSLSKYVKLYYQKWFDGEDSNRVINDMLAYKEKRFPFDEETTRDYEDVCSFYSFISDSHPQFSKFVSRMFTVSPRTTSLDSTIPGLTYLSINTKTAYSPNQLIPLLQIGLALAKPGHRQLNGTTTYFFTEGMNNIPGVPELSTWTTIWDRNHWQTLSLDWERIVEEELSISEEFDEVTNISPDALLHIKISLQDLFIQELPSMVLMV